MAEQTTPGAGPKHPPTGTNRTFQVSGQTSVGAGSATVAIEVSNDGNNFINMATFSLTLSTTTVDEGVAVSNAWKYVRANLTAISGTGAAVSAIMGTARE